MTQPLLELKGITRTFMAGEREFIALKGIDLTIHAGEMVAIIGASGSGKSTLMNILGGLDYATAGSYKINGIETRSLGDEQLAELRRDYFGFIFQRYHLLAHLSALHNVEMPAIYAGTPETQRHSRARELLTRLGLAGHTTHRPSQLSGGQQQRVSIARALMNGGEVILADEPTGALDTHSGKEVMKILLELNAEGHTVIIVTHDMQVAEHAQRIIEISDGVIIKDRRKESAALPEKPSSSPPKMAPVVTMWRAGLDRLSEAFHMSLLAMNAHRLRTFLTMLGIIIGIASVVSVVALGAGSRERILKDISAMGTNTIDVFPGSDFGDMKAAAIRTLVPADADALAQQGYVDSVTPSVSTTSSIRFRNVSVSAMISGVGEQYFRVRGLAMTDGKSFDLDSVERRAQEVVIDANTRKKLFPENVNPVGEVIFLGSVPCRIIGVTKKQESGFGNNDSLNVWVPYTTAMSRLLGQNYLKGITVRVSDSVSSAAAEQGIVKLMTLRHRTKDFYVFNTDSIRQTIEKTTATLTLLVSMIAVISLVVGGIGVMNIMLVSVTVRTREIGIRMAIGARSFDVLFQFLTESVMVCVIGGLAGFVVGIGGGITTSAIAGWRVIFTGGPVVVAFACAFLM